MTEPPNGERKVGLLGIDDGRRCFPTLQNIAQTLGREIIQRRVELVSLAGEEDIKLYNAAIYGASEDGDSEVSRVYDHPVEGLYAIIVIGRYDNPLHFIQAFHAQIQVIAINPSRDDLAFYLKPVRRARTVDEAVIIALGEIEEN